MIESISFVVKKHAFEETDKREPRYKVVLKDKVDGHTMTIYGATKEIYEGFPLGETIKLRVDRAQKTL